jgi:OmpA-OmpF porin, OOP family
MRSVRVTAGIAGCCVLAVVMPATAQETGRPYINLGVGASFLEGLQAKGTGGETLDLNENPGPMGVIALGYGLPDNFRAEIEYGYRHNDAKNITLPSGATTPTALGLKANAMANSYMANLYYDFHPVWGFIPHIGAGVGAADVRVNNVGSDWPFAWQAMAGAEYPVSYNARVGVEYRFLGTEGMTFKPNPLTEPGHTNYYDHAVLINFRWAFGSPPPPPPPPAVAPAVYSPPPPAPAPPQPKAFTVYFALNSAKLSSEGRQIVREAAGAARQDQATRIAVTGHTDTTGTNAYNQKLSDRRAAAVRDELVKDGVPSDEISIAGLGESQLAVPTADNVREPRNRRVEIVEQGPGM